MNHKLLQGGIALFLSLLGLAACYASFLLVRDAMSYLGCAEESPAMILNIQDKPHYGTYTTLRILEGEAAGTIFTEDSNWPFAKVSIKDELRVCYRFFPYTDGALFYIKSPLRHLILPLLAALPCIILAVFGLGYGLAFLLGKKKKAHKSY